MEKTNNNEIYERWCAHQRALGLPEPTYPLQAYTQATIEIWRRALPPRKLENNELIKVGDVIVRNGKRITVADIHWNEAWDDDGHICEFYDTEGHYRNWKQYLDGGYVERP